MGWVYFLLKIQASLGTMGVTDTPRGVTGKEMWGSTALSPGITLSAGSPNQMLTAFLSSSHCLLPEGVTGLCRRHPLEASVTTFCPSKLSF